MNIIIRIIIAIFVIIFAGIGWTCDNFLVRFIFYLCVCFAMDAYHEFRKKTEKNENK